LWDHVNDGGFWRNYASGHGQNVGDYSLAPLPASCMLRSALHRQPADDAYITETILAGKPVGLPHQAPDKQPEGDTHALV
jgi:hypothetical protein